MSKITIEIMSPNGTTGGVFIYHNEKALYLQFSYFIWPLGNDAEKGTAGCRALNRKYIVIGGYFETVKQEYFPRHSRSLLPPEP